MNELDQKLRDYYQSQTLPDHRVARILETTQMIRRPFWRQAPTRLAIAASIAALLGLCVFWLRSGPALEVLVAQDVWKNHRKQLAPEVTTSSFAEIQQALPRLEFAIIPTQPEMLEGMKLVGGRYCSILDELAAQISLVDATGRPCTLYVAPLTPPLSKVTPGIYPASDGTVQVWTDAHRIFALARESR